MANQPFRGGDQTLESPADDPRPQESSRRLGASSRASVGDASGSRDAVSGEPVDSAPSSGALLGMDCLPPALIDSVLGGMLEPAERAHSYEHLAGCPACVGRLTRAGEQLLGGGSLGPGRLVARRYRIIRFVAQGGMGEVYEAYDSELNVRVALKMVPAAGEQRASSLRALAREVLLARSIAHPNVCRIFDLGLHEGDLRERALRFLTMEFVDGERLSAYIAQGPMALGLVHAIARDLLRGLAAAHRAGVLHRDFKSDNVLLREGVTGVPQAVVMDFGLARSLAQHEAQSSVNNHRIEGSLYYMAPEQLLGQALGWETDIYGFGVVLFEMLTGRTPFEEQITLGAAMQRCNAPPPRASALVPELPEALEHLVQRCLSPQRADRFQSADAALAALEHAFAAPAALWFQRLWFQRLWFQRRWFQREGSERALTRVPLLVGFMALAGLGLEADQLPLQTRDLALTPAPSSAAVVGEPSAAALPLALPSFEPLSASPEPSPPDPGEAPRVSAPVVGVPRAPSRPLSAAARPTPEPGVAANKVASQAVPSQEVASEAVASGEVVSEATRTMEAVPARAMASDEGELLVSELPLSEPSEGEAAALNEAVPERDHRDTLFDPFMAEAAPGVPASD